MANQPTIGVFLPSFLNACNSPGPTGQQDAYGTNYPTGLNPGKMIQLGTGEAQELAAPGTTLYDGAYMWVNLDSGATAANATVGLAAYIKLDSGATQGALPETAYQGPNVTTSDQVTGGDEANLFAGVFINPATIGGVANTPTPGNWIMIFVGAGRAAVQIGTATNVNLGAPVNAGGTAGVFNTSAAFSTVATAPTVAKAVTVPASTTAGVAYFSDIFYRLPN